MAGFSAGNNTRFSGSVVAGGAIYAAGTTNYNVGDAGSASTKLPTGVVKANQGFVTVQGNAVQLAQGTYIGSGAATAPLVVTGLSSIARVFMDRTVPLFSTTATSKDGRIAPNPQLAAGTPGSFYPSIYRSTATNKNVTLGAGYAATYTWFAWGKASL